MRLPKNHGNAGPTAMSTGSTILLVCIFLFTDALVIGAVVASAASTLRGLAEKFPGQPVDDGAVRRRFRGFSFDILNLEWCIHVAVDARHLHLEPVRFLRMFGARRMSIPWDAVALERRGSRWRSARARIGGVSVKGPDWCFALAE